MLEIFLMERARLLLELKKLQSSVYNNIYTRKRLDRINTQVKDVERKIAEVLDHESY